MIELLFRTDKHIGNYFPDFFGPHVTIDSESVLLSRLYPAPSFENTESLACRSLSDNNHLFFLNYPSKSLCGENSRLNI